MAQVALSDRVQAAIAQQRALRARLLLQPLTAPITTIAGIDVSNARFSNDLYAAAVLCTFDGLHVQEVAYARMRATFPYVPGLLSFRELPVMLQAIEALSVPPDLIMVDGQGIAHPRRLGIAAHLGLTLDIPAIGVAKSRLFGEGSLPCTVGESSLLRDPQSHEVVGAYVQTKARANPLVISPGHRVTLSESIDLVLRTVRGYRIPEPTRRAHMFVNAYRTSPQERLA